EWLLGRGWDQNLWEGRQFPTNEALEEVFPNKKILLLRIDGHASLVSKAALELAGISAKTQIEGGEVLLGKDGKPTGVLIDNADAPVKALVPKLTDDEKKTALLEAQKRCFAFGLTSVTDAGLPYAT
ncbi:MAG TPA: amidohydrolase family protein, partial [Bacteroidales bacterium]|nr:amidohydrolase family protein [Bacteroidales bacterium]